MIKTGAHWDTPDDYSIFHAQSPDEVNKYSDFLIRVYNKLNFLGSSSEKFMPNEDDQRFLLYRKCEHIGIFCLRDVEQNDQYFSPLVPGLGECNCKAIEINNVVLEKHYRGSIGLTMILYHAALYAIEHSYDYLVGIVRYQALRFFVEAGSTPLYHSPLHLLGKESLKDFITYFDLTEPQAVEYLHQRARKTS